MVDGRPIRPALGEAVKTWRLAQIHQMEQPHVQHMEMYAPLQPTEISRRHLPGTRQLPPDLPRRLERNGHPRRRSNPGPQLLRKIPQTHPGGDSPAGPSGTAPPPTRPWKRAGNRAWPTPWPTELPPEHWLKEQDGGAIPKRTAPVQSLLTFRSKERPRVLPIRTAELLWPVRSNPRWPRAPKHKARRPGRK